MAVKATIFVAATTFMAPVNAQVLRDYSFYDHTVKLTSMRAGNHDENGKNDYFLKLQQFALVNSKEERLKELKDRKKNAAGSQTFATIEIAPLTYWAPQESENSDDATLPFNAVRITGDSIRAATSDMMRAESLQEADVAHMVVIELYERNKKYFFLNDDRAIASTTYFPIPPSSFDGQERVDHSLQISDDKGALLKFSVTYDKPIQVKSAEPTPASTQQQASPNTPVKR